jgi:decaprenylphospho-beta-D-ribofuranose 2-oxidase
VETEQRALTGWGRTAPTVATVVRATADELVTDAGLSATVGARGAIARGLGRSYGDPAQNGGGTVIELLPGAEPIRIDAAVGIAHVQAAVSLDQLLREIVPQGWFVPVTPGTRFVTVGGAVASDIHGKNHHRDGSVGAHVVGMQMLCADGSHRAITPQSDPELWWATIGGMGLTGLITHVSFRLIPIETRHCVVDTRRVPNLDSLIEQMEASDHLYRYSVAWIDLVATGNSLGRSVLSLGNHASLAELLKLNPKAAHDPLDFDPRVFPDVPNGVPNVLIKPSVRAFNELWYRKAPRRRRDEVQTIGTFFHPLDIARDWNRLYGRPGFLQWQTVVPFGAEALLRTALERLSAAGLPSFLSVLKRFGPGTPGPLSFPIPGWTLALDLPASGGTLGPLLDELDQLVAEVGGRVYLAKDSRLDPDLVPVMYPELAQWQDHQRAVDPRGVLRSDLARRLRLV